MKGVSKLHGKVHRELFSQERIFTIILICLFVTITISPVASATDNENIKIVELYVFSSPGCEYLVLENWGSDTSLQGWAVTNGRGTIYLPDVILVSGARLVLAEEVDGYREVWQKDPDYTWDEGGLLMDGYFRLVDTGNNIMLTKNNRAVDTFCYGDGEDGVEGWIGPRYGTMGRGFYAKRNSVDTDTVADWTWTRKWRIGQTNFTAEPMDIRGRAKAFVAPDSSYDAMMNFLDGVENNLVVGVYILSHRHLADRIAALATGGVDVRVLVEGSPAGGMSEEGMDSLRIIHGAGGTVNLLRAGNFSPYNFFHCK